MSNETPEKPRWIYRFDNYKRAFGLLREGMEIMEERELTQLEKEGVIQRFEYTWELAWKLIKDYLSHEGLVLDKITPASVIRAALEAKLIKHGEIWMNALDDRNKMSHVYNFKEFEKVIEKINNYYLQIFDELHFFMLEEHKPMSIEIYLAKSTCYPSFCRRQENDRTRQMTGTAGAR